MEELTSENTRLHEIQKVKEANERKQTGKFLRQMILYACGDHTDLTVEVAIKTLELSPAIRYIKSYFAVCWRADLPSFSQLKPNSN